MFERFARETRAAVVAAVEEARRRGDRRIGTDHLVLGLLHDDAAASILSTTLDEARTADEALDSAALQAVGLDLDAAPREWATISKMGRTPFSSGAREVVRRTLAHATAERSKSIEMRHLLVTLVELNEPDPAATLLTALSVDRDAVRAALAQPRAA